LTEYDEIEYGVRSNCVIIGVCDNHRRIVTYKIFINEHLKHANVTIRLALYIY